MENRLILIIIACGIISYVRAELSGGFCVAEGYECPGANIEDRVRRAPDEQQCKSRCAGWQGAGTCLGIYYDDDSICSLRDARCDKISDMIPRKTSHLYRLKKTEGSSCPEGSKLYGLSRRKRSVAKPELTKSFCMIKGKRCNNWKLYAKAQRNKPWAECLKTCVRIESCSMTNIYPNENWEYCDPMETSCTINELQDDADSVVYIRLNEAHQNNCPTGWTKAGDPLGADTTEVTGLAIEYEWVQDNPDAIPEGDYSSSYCEFENHECKTTDLETPWAADITQCTARCNRHPSCVGVQFGYPDQICHLKSERCGNLDGMVDRTVKSFYAKDKGVDCPAGQELWTPPPTIYSNDFCVMVDKSCKNEGLYLKGQNLKDVGSLTPWQKCQEKCTKIGTCGGVDYYSAENKYCLPKVGRCTEFEDSPGTYHYIRKLVDETGCPSGSVPADTVTPPVHPLYPENSGSS